MATMYPKCYSHSRLIISKCLPRAPSPMPALTLQPHHVAAVCTKKSLPKHNRPHAHACDQKHGVRLVSWSHGNHCMFSAILATSCSRFRFNAACLFRSIWSSCSLDNLRCSVDGVLLPAAA